MKSAFGITFLIFLIVDVLFYFATPYAYRHEHRYSLIPGGGMVAYFSYVAEKP